MGIQKSPLLWFRDAINLVEWVKVPDNTSVQPWIADKTTIQAWIEDGKVVDFAVSFRVHQRWICDFKEVIDRCVRGLSFISLSGIPKSLHLHIVL